MYNLIRIWPTMPHNVSKCRKITYQLNAYGYRLWRYDKNFLEILSYLKRLYVGMMILLKGNDELFILILDTKTF